ncbi:MAG: hypothetical protein GXX96_23645 [Planctomycetaceae bacterium]|jgi:hypothetical protein|nr:hypothetical protein [Planctomycetaceae bacterium]
MADVPLKYEYRIPRALGYLNAGGSLYLAGLAIGWALSEPYGFYRWEWVSQATGVLLFGCGSFWLARRSLYLLSANRREPRYVELTGDTLKVPEIHILGRITEVLVPLDQVTRMRCRRIGDSESLHLWYAKTSTGIAGECLARPQEFKTLRTALTERLQTRGVPIEEREFRFSRPQFSLRFLFLVTTAVALVFGLLAYAGAPLGFEGSVFLLLLISFEITVITALTSGRWWMKALAVGFIAGFILEVCVVYHVMDSATNGMALPGGGPLVYPITSLLWQDVLPDHGLLAMLAGPALSGLLFGLLTLGVVAVVKRQLRKRKAARAGG